MSFNLLLRRALIALSAVLAACQTPSHIDPSKTLESKWLSEPSVFEEHRQWVSSNTAWRLVAKVGMSTPSVKEAANLVWSKENEYSTLRLFGPLGVGSVRIELNADRATLIDNKGQEYFSDDAESLLLDVAGWAIPVDALQYWALALPAPELAYEYQLDQLGQLTSLRQKGWLISYSKYQPFNGLPTKAVNKNELAQADAAAATAGLNENSIETSNVILPRKILAEKMVNIDGIEQSIKVRFIVKSFSLTK